MIESEPKVEELRVIQKVHGVCYVTCILTIFFEHDIVLQTKGSSTPKLFLYLYLKTILDITL